MLSKSKEILQPGSNFKKFQFVHCYVTDHVLDILSTLRLVQNFIPLKTLKKYLNTFNYHLTSYKVYALFKELYLAIFDDSSKIFVK